MSNELDPRAVNSMLIEQLTSNDPAQVKEAAENINDFTRSKMRERGFWRNVLTPKTIDFSDLTPQVDTDKPVKVVEMEPNSAGAITIPYGTLPVGEYMKGKKYRVMFARMSTPRMSKDVVELGTYTMDLRQVFADNMIKDLSTHEDSRAIAQVNRIIGAAGSTVALTGTIQHRNIDGAVTRETVNDALKILNQTPSELANGKMLINQVTVKDFQKAGPDEIGPGIAEEIAVNGFSSNKMFGVPVVVTIKRAIVGDGTAYLFADPEYMGKFFILEDTSMIIKREGHMIDMYATQCVGGSIGNVASVARVNFTSANATASGVWRY
jgi:hypothetical protein